jgi:inosose dehydratase
MEPPGPATALRNRVGINPIGWSNDDFHDLGGEISLDQCLSEMRAAGFEGAELGHKFPREPEALATVLKSHDLRLVSGWHSTFLARRDFSDELQSFRKHLGLLKACGAQVAIVAECTDCLHSEPQRPLDFETGRPTLAAGEWAQVLGGLEEFAKLAASEGLEVVYHHHMGTVVQREADLHRLLLGAPSLRLLYDTGHLSFAGIDPIKILRQYGPRIAHVHLKNVRPGIVDQARAAKWSFAASVRNGVFTVPGDREGAVDFKAVFAGLADLHYRGWLVVEAEQDPAKANPLEFATMARDYIRQQTGL